MPLLMDVLNQVVGSLLRWPKIGCQVGEIGHRLDLLGQDDLLQRLGVPEVFRCSFQPIIFFYGLDYGSN